MTTLVALHVGRTDERGWELDRLREQGADALPLGTDALVAHLGARRAHGDEGARALELGLALSARGAKVGVATGRMRVDRTRSAGEVVDQAAALAREAGAGGLYADATTADLARGRFQFKMISPGMAMVVGLGQRGGTAAALAPFVGRDAEFIATARRLRSLRRGRDARGGHHLRARRASASVEAGARVRRAPHGGHPHTPVGGAPASRPGGEGGRDARLGRKPRLVIVRCESYGRGQALGVAADALRSLLVVPKGASLEQATLAVGERKLHNQGRGPARPAAREPALPRGHRSLRGARDALLSTSR